MLLKKIDLFAISEIRRKFVFWAKNFRPGCRSFVLRVQRIVFKTNVVLWINLHLWWQYFAEFLWSFRKTVFAWLSKHALSLSTRTFWGKIHFLWNTSFAFEIGRKNYSRNFVEHVQQLCKNWNLGIEENVLRKNRFSKCFFLLDLSQTLSEI